MPRVFHNIIFIYPAVDKAYSNGLDIDVINKSSVSSYPVNDNYTIPNHYIQKLRGNATKIGAGIFLKIIAGDKLNVHVSSWYIQKKNKFKPFKKITMSNAIIHKIQGKGYLIHAP